MWELISIVRPKVKAYWKFLAYSMGYCIYDVKRLEGDGKDLDERCYKLFEDWLSTERGCTPKTWKKLLECIKAVEELNVVAKEIENKLSAKQ